MQKLMKMTPLSDSFSCNFNVLVGGTPRVMGVGEILDEWTAWRTESVRRRVHFDLQKKKAKLHLLKGLRKILLDIDRAISIIRDTEADAEVVPNLMIGFGIDEVQANYVAEIKLRNINREYILKQTRAIEDLEQEIADLQSILKNPRKLQKVLIDELNQVVKKYAQPRKTQIIYNAAEEAEETEAEEEIPTVPVHLFVSKQGYLKKITPQSLRMSGEQKFKEGDELDFTLETTSRAELLVFTDKFQCYKTKLSDFEDSKASVLGDYLPTKLGFEPGETVVKVVPAGDYTGFVLFFFENGKAAKVPLNAYETKTNRKKLTGAYCDKSPLRTILTMNEDDQIVVYSTDNRAMVCSTALLAPKTTRNTQGVNILTLRKKAALDFAEPLNRSNIKTESRYRAKAIPAAGAVLKPEEAPHAQVSMGL
jgi:DNA gyrase subunit A